VFKFQQILIGRKNLRMSLNSDMMKAFVDTDVIFDFLLRREPFAHDAALLFNAGRQGRLQLHVARVELEQRYV